MSTPEHRSYSRGYYRGRMLVSDRITRALKIAKSYREEAKKLRAHIFGKDNWVSRECRTCERWTRNGGNTKWGVCACDFLSEVGEPMMWPEEGSRITTHDDFGCCNHLRDNPLRRKSKQERSP